MIVTIPRKQNHEGFLSMTLEISDYCPDCGKKRGLPKPGFSYDGSRKLNVSVWENPCGHIDKYSDIRKELLEQLT